jgi:hypothetical protein
MKKNNKKYVLIMHSWNIYIIPADALATRPKAKDFHSYSSTDAMAAAFSEADDRWFATVEHYYATPELLERWNFKHGWGVRESPYHDKVDVNDLAMGRDFDTTRMNTIHHVKIAHGAKTETFKDYPCAIPVPIKSRRKK